MLSLTATAPPRHAVRAPAHPVTHAPHMLRDTGPEREVQVAEITPRVGDAVPWPPGTSQE
eukprot:4723086-Prymnesium_polylepis.1